jgi:hypothetical protein
MSDQFKDMMDVSYECSNAISVDENVEVLKAVDCSSSEARWDFRIIVSSNILAIDTLFLNNVSINAQKLTSLKGLQPKIMSSEQAILILLSLVP